MGQANASGPSLIGTFWKEENEDGFEEMLCLYFVFNFLKIIHWCKRWRIFACFNVGLAPFLLPERFATFWTTIGFFSGVGKDMLLHVFFAFHSFRTEMATKVFWTKLYRSILGHSSIHDYLQKWTTRYHKKNNPSVFLVVSGIESLIEPFGGSRFQKLGKFHPIVRMHWFNVPFQICQSLFAGIIRAQWQSFLTDFAHGKLWIRFKRLKVIPYTTFLFTWPIVSFGIGMFISDVRFHF